MLTNPLRDVSALCAAGVLFHGELKQIVPLCRLMNVELSDDGAWKSRGVARHAAHRQRLLRRVRDLQRSSGRKVTRMWRMPRFSCSTWTRLAST